MGSNLQAVTDTKARQARMPSSTWLAICLLRPTVYFKYNFPALKASPHHREGKHNRNLYREQILFTIGYHYITLNAHNLI